MRLFGHCLGAAFIALTLWVSTACGQSFGFNPSASNPNPEQPAIQKYINDQISILRGTDRGAVVAAREALLAPIVATGGALPSQAFIELYVIEVADRIGKAVDTNDSHVRINAAIVIERLTDQTRTTRFAPQIAKLIGDDSPAITIWGLKAAAPIMPALATDPNANSTAVFENLQASIIVHRDRAEVVEEAYNALTSVLKSSKAVNDLGKQKTAVLGRIVDEIQALIETRLASEAVSPRPGPVLEERGGLRFIVQYVWKELNDAQKARSAQLIIDQLNTSLARVLAGKDPMATQEQKDLMIEHTELIKRTGRLLQSLADITKEQQLIKPATDVSRLNTSVLPPAFSDTIKSASDMLTKLFPAPATAPAQ